MNGSNIQISEFKYRAFISYSREDRDLVDDLYKRLTKWRAPGPLRKRQGKYGAPPRSLSVYMDRKSQQTGEILSSGLRDKLEQSAFLIVVCSKAGADPDSWVTREIDHFLKIASPDRIIPIIVREDVNRPLEEIFPAPLLAMGEDAPIGADMLHDGGIVPVTHKIIGGLTGFSQNEIAREQELANRRRRRIDRVAILSVTFLLIIASILGISTLIQRQSVLKSESRFLSRISAERSQLADYTSAAFIALLGLPTVEKALLGRPLGHETLATLHDAMRHYRLERIWKAHDAGMKDLDFDPTGVLLASGSEVGVLRVWRFEDETLVWQARNDGAPLVMVRFSPDGKSLLSLSDNGTLRLWDAQNGRTIDAPALDNTTFFNAEFGSNNDSLITASWDGAVIAWRRSEGTWDKATLGSFEASTLSQEGQVAFASRMKHPPVGIKFDKSRKQVVLYRMGGNAFELWDFDKRTLISRFDIDPQSGIREVIVSDDGSWCLVLTFVDGRQLWDLSNSSHPLRVIPEPPMGASHRIVRAADISDDGSFFVTGSFDGSVWISDRHSDSKIQFAAHAGAVEALILLPDGERLLSTGTDGLTRVWDVRSRALIAEFAPDGVGQYRIPHYPIVDNHANRLVLTSRDGFIRSWSLNDHKYAPTLITLPGSVLWAAHDVNWNRIAAVTYDGNARESSVVLSSIHDRKVERIIDASPGQPPRISFSDNGRVVLSYLNGAMQVWNPEDGALVRSIPGGRTVVSESKLVCGDQFLVTSSWDGRVRIRDYDTLSELRTVRLSPSNRPLYIEVNCEFSRVYFSSSLGGVYQWNFNRSGVPFELYRHNDIVRDLAYNSNRKFLATASDDKTAIVWDLSQRKEAARLPHNARVLTVDFSADGERLITTANDRVIRVWRLKEGKWSIEQHASASRATVLNGAFFNRNNSYFVSVSGERALRIWPYTELSSVQIVNAVCGREDFAQTGLPQVLTEVGSLPQDVVDEYFGGMTPQSPCHLGGLLDPLFYSTLFANSYSALIDMRR